MAAPLMSTAQRQPDDTTQAHRSSMPPSNNVYSSTDPTPNASHEDLSSLRNDQTRVLPNIMRDIEKQQPASHGDVKTIDGPKQRLPIKQRMHHFTWAWYTLTMSTGGISTLLEVQPHQFSGLFEIGIFFYALNLTLFTSISFAMLYRFMAHPGDFKKSLRHEREGLFVPTLFLSIATIISGTHKFIVQPAGVGTSPTDAGRWLLTTIAVCYWIYFIATFILAVVQYSFLFASHRYLLEKAMPSWFLPIFPVMLTGTIASIIAIDQPVSTRMPILVAGLAAQGLGFWIAILLYAHLIGRLMSAGLPCREHRPALFIGVGPPSFTALAVIGMSNAIPDSVTINGFVEPSIFRAVALLVAISLWLLAFWFFVVASICVLYRPPQAFHLGLWSCVFPNTGFTIATISIGNALDSEALRYVGNAMTVLLVCLWIMVVVLQARAVWLGDIMFPGRDEDVED